MPKFILEINMKSDEGIRNPEDIADEIIHIGNVLKQMPNIEDLYSRCGIRDINGYVVGHYGVTE
jgi:hypothetical protein